MDDIDALIETLRSLFTYLERLKQIQESDLLLPGSIDQYWSLLDDIYAVYSRVQTTIDEPEQQLEYEHSRLDKAVKLYGRA